MKYRVLEWHTCSQLPKKFTDMLQDDLEVDSESNVKPIKTIDFDIHPFNEVIEALNGLNMMILNDVNVIWIDSRRFRQS